METHSNWACSPQSMWVRTLIGELEPSQRAELRKRQRALATISADDFMTRWSLSAEFAKAVVELWLQGRDLDAVLTKSDAFGHGSLRSGVVLTGGLVREWAAGHDVKLAELMGWVRALTPEGTATLYRVEPSNHFQTEDDTRAPLDGLESELHARIQSRRGGCGALNSTFEYEHSGGGESSGVSLLDGLMAHLDDLAYVQSAEGETAATRLNERLYLIWKLQGYCTPYHQDIHVAPHFTLYNQVSGVSTFHFLPLLVGLHAASVGRHDGPDALRRLLTELSARGIGEVATIGPKQMLLILPMGAHGVFVPRAPPPPSGAGPELAACVQANAPLPPFDLSVIRAAELFVSPVTSHYERALVGAGDEAWRNVLELSASEVAEEAEQVRAFAAQQKAVCSAMGIGREEWLWLATRLQREWDAAAAPAGGEGEMAKAAASGVADDDSPSDGDIVDADESL